MPAADFSSDELLYPPRNVRAHRLYGMSPVEQIALTVNIALRRDAATLDYYRAGSTPDAFATLPSRRWDQDARGGERRSGAGAGGREGAGGRAREIQSQPRRTGTVYDFRWRGRSWRPAAIEGAAQGSSGRKPQTCGVSVRPACLKAGDQRNILFLRPGELWGSFPGLCSELHFLGFAGNRTLHQRTSRL